jgi:tRNA-Thr(GGU) m(6)t(6)A37 methyltransferase TsaA
MSATSREPQLRARFPSLALGARRCSRLGPGFLPAMEACFGQLYARFETFAHRRFAPGRCPWQSLRAGSRIGRTKEDSRSCKTQGLFLLSGGSGPPRAGSKALKKSPHAGAQPFGNEFLRAHVTCLPARCRKSRAADDRSYVVKKFFVAPIGVIRSEIKNKQDAPLFYTEGAPNAILEILPACTDGLDRMHVGDEIIVITWLHQARRDVLKVHPRGDASNPLTGVFSTRSPDRPNPLGLHRAKVLQIKPGVLYIGPIEAIDGTPVLDIKPVVESEDY